MLTKKSWIWILLGVLAAIAISAVVVIKQDGMVNRDFFLYWLGGKFAATGQYVYDKAAWDAGHVLYGSTWMETPFFYPLYLAYLLIPLGVMNLYLAAILWCTISILCVAWAGWYICLRDQKALAPLYIFVVIIGCLVFRPVILNVYVGQMDAPLFGLVVLSAIQYQKGRYEWAGVLLALLLIKPNIGAPIAGMVLLYCLFQRNWRTIIAFIITLVVFFGATLLLRPTWIADFLAQGVERSDFVLSYTPTWWGQASNFCGWTRPCLFILGVIGCLVIVLIGVWILYKNHHKMDIWMATSIAIFITLQITPYMWAYNQIHLLIPILMVGAHFMKTRTLLIGSIIPILMSLVSVLFIFIALQTGHDNMSYWLTIFVALVWGITFRKTFALKALSAGQGVK